MSSWHWFHVSECLHGLHAQVWDLQRGSMSGSVSGQKVGNSDVPNAQNDGGFGSIPQALFQTIPGTASGALQGL